VTPCDIQKRREIVFHGTPPGQAGQALDLLSGLPGLEVEALGAVTLEVRYCVVDYMLRDLEEALFEQGFHLEGTLLLRLKRALIYYSERVQRENMVQPEVRTKNYYKAHMEGWEKRPHGDHDETPAEWRQYK
jgi:hypothetical protein